MSGLLTQEKISELMRHENVTRKLLEFWFSNRNLWFNATEQDDSTITRRFYHYLDLYAAEDFENVPDDLLGKIILYDQLTRHFYRSEPEKWKLYLPIACSLAKDAIAKQFDKFYSPAQKSFLLMPLRHSDSLADVKIALEKIKEYISVQEDSIYKTFYYHTLKKYGKLENRRQFMLDRRSTNHIPNWLLYYAIVDRRFKSWFSSPRFMYDFGEQDIDNLNITTRILREDDIFNKIHDTVVKNRMKTVCVSLSGGVDSMVVLTSLIVLRNIGFIDTVTGFHINYGNRYKSWLEREFVVRFCIKHDVHLIIRDIDEIKRDKRSREIYEDVTRHVRYEMYKLINMPIFFGHNRDDCLENMVTNIKKNQHFDNLYGMTEKSDIDGVTVYRPLLEFTKDSIIGLANRLNLHHTRNSTPKWSDRWNIRNVFLEFVEEKQPGFTKGLMNISSTLEETYKMVNSTIEHHMGRVDTTVTDSSITISIPDYDGSFRKEVWSGIIIAVCKEHDISVPTHKSICNFLCRKNTATPRVNLGKNLYAVYSRANTERKSSHETDTDPLSNRVVIYYVKSDDPVIRRR